MIEKEIYDRLREVLVLLAFSTDEVLRPYQLTLEQYDTLLHLSPDNGWRMGDLAQKTLVDNSKMTRIVDYLESQGWAERRPDAADRRAQRVYLTAVGETHHAAAQAAHDAALQTWLSDFSATEKEQLFARLEQLRQHLRTYMY
ncbi:MAG TPA: MarR family winged helix-turn-helix transcriptional regulator [Chloroflexota bacterium]|nr:MarR family winged helix-turn-helix transcriptional regulator [Chloroflexota bacterium]